MERITSRSNPLITRVRKLAADRKARRAEGVMLCEGPKMLEEALRWGADLETVLTEDGYSPSLPAGIRHVSVPPDLLRAVAPTQAPQKTLFLCRIPSGALPDPLSGRRFLVLDGLQDPGNVGTLWRTADAFGADGVILLPGCADPWSPKTIRATMGACFRLPLWECTLPSLLSALEKAAVPLYASALREDTRDLRSLSLTRAAVVIGSEGRGVSAPVLESCQASIRIPMAERCESLNAAVAGAVVLWEMARNHLLIQETEADHE